MTQFRYRALDASGAVVSGTVAAAAPGEAAARIERRGLILLDALAPDAPTRPRRAPRRFAKPRTDDVTRFSGDLALLLRAGARLDDALDMLGADGGGRLAATIADLRLRVLAGDSLAAALEAHPALFPPAFIALIRVGEASGALDGVLDVLALERARSDALRRKVTDALRYPLFVLAAAGAVLAFFMVGVLPQFAAVLRDFGARVDPAVTQALALSEWLTAHGDVVLAGAASLIAAAWLTLRAPQRRSAVVALIAKLPGIATAFASHRTALFARNLGLLLGSGVTLSAALRILTDMMAPLGDAGAWQRVAERVRQGGKLADALGESRLMPAMAVRMLRLGDETGQMAMLADRVADLYEARLQRLLDRLVGIAGPAAIIVISLVVGGLIVSVMTALMSVSQIVG